jgi:hypothetical protein
MRVAQARLIRAAAFVAFLTAPAAAQQKPTLQPDDYARWESLGATELSPNGRLARVHGLARR